MDVPEVLRSGDHARVADGGGAGDRRTLEAAQTSITPGRAQRRGVRCWRGEWASPILLLPEMLLEQTRNGTPLTSSMPRTCATTFRLRSRRHAEVTSGSSRATRAGAGLPAFHPSSG